MCQHSSGEDPRGFIAHNKIMASNGEKVGIVGSGLVGKSWAMIFASKGFQVIKYWSILPICKGCRIKNVQFYF